jgi:hypothetical protein
VCREQTLIQRRHSAARAAARRSPTRSATQS